MDAPDIRVSEKVDTDKLLDSLPRAMQEHIRNLNPRFFEMSEQQLMECCQPDDTVSMLRLTFWDEWWRSVRTNTKFKLDNVLRDVCSYRFWHLRTANQKDLAVIITPLPKYEVRARHFYNLGLNQMRTILEAPVINEDGKVDKQLAQLQVKITQMMENRVMGAVPQSLNVRQQNLNYNVDGGSQKIAPKTVGEIEGELRQLDSQIKELSSADNKREAVDGDKAEEISFAPAEEKF